MAGCFGNSPVDKYLEGQLMQHLSDEGKNIDRLNDFHDAIVKVIAEYKDCFDGDNVDLWEVSIQINDSKFLDKI